MKNLIEILNNLLEPKNAVDTEFYEDGKEWQGFDVGMISKEQRYRKPVTEYSAGLEVRMHDRQIFEDFMNYIKRFFIK